MRTITALALLALLALLAACGPARQAQPTAPPAPTVPVVGELLAGPTPGPVRVVGYLGGGPGAATLSDSLLAGASGQAPAGIWIGATPALGEGGAAAELGGASYTLVEARGQLEGPGAFGPGGQYAYQISAPTLTPLSVREISLPLLLENSGLYVGQPVRLRGQLLVGPGSAILVERLGAGGVPDATALQIKLAPPPDDPTLGAALRPAANGAVRFGPVEITGLWRGDRLHPLSIRPQ
jgi:hypothetical protein